MCPAEILVPKFFYSFMASLYLTLLDINNLVCQTSTQSKPKNGHGPDEDSDFLGRSHLHEEAAAKV